MTGSVNLVGDGADQLLTERESHPELAPGLRLPDDTQLWAALQQHRGGTWGGCVYDVDVIIAALKDK